MPQRAPFLVSAKLNILNEGNEPTPVISKGKEVTLLTDNIGYLETNWDISDDMSLSDHRHTILPVDDQAVTRLRYRSRCEFRFGVAVGDRHETGYLTFHSPSNELKNCHLPN
jgi:hypothetical protein